MIIKNNFNDKNASPLRDYKSIGGTRVNAFLNDEEEKKDEDSLNNRIIKDVIEPVDEEENDEDSGRWDFFK